MISIDHDIALQKAACIYKSKVPDDEPQRNRSLTFLLTDTIFYIEYNETY